MARKIKVLQVIKSLGRGGAETLLAQTLRVHDTDRFEFSYIYFLPHKDQMVEPITNQGAPVYCFSATSNFKILGQYRKLLKFIADHQIDIVHAHLPWAGFVSRLARWVRPFKLVYTEHNSQSAYNSITRFINKVSYNQQEVAIPVSKAAEHSIKTEIKPLIPVITVPNGINTDIYVKDERARQQIRNKLGATDQTIVIGTIAVFRHQKRLDVWLDVFSELLKKHQNIRAVLVGAGPEFDLIQEKVISLGIQEFVTLPGLQTNSPEWLSAFDVYFMSSEMEGLPLALLEAMSSECAVVSTNVGGVGEVIEHNQSGLLAPFGDSQSLLSHLDHCVSDVAYRSQLSANARQRIVSEFSLQKMVNQLEKIYEDLYIGSL